MDKEYILVTGASGFIGRHVIDALNDRAYPAIALVRNKAAYKRLGGELVLEGDLQDEAGVTDLLSKYTVKACIHLAWEGIPDYSFELSGRNLQYGISVLRLCRDLGIPHLIISGSCWEYQSPHGKIGEDWPLDASSHFKAAKNSLYMISHAFCREQGICLNWLRLFYVYGFGQRPDSLIPYITGELAAGRAPGLKGGNNKNDFVHVLDVAEAIVKAVERRPGTEVLNIGSGKSVRVGDILSMAAGQMGVRLSVDFSSKNTGDTDFCADIQRAAAALAWKPEIQIEDGIRQYIAMFREAKGSSL